MNKIFKTKYDITTGQCKAVSELASNRQIASSSESKPKCGVFFGVFGAFKLAPLALALSVVLRWRFWDKVFPRCYRITRW
ncbi:ESPR-type extended signal peptide-containing protein [Histophilus somni]